MRDFNSGDINGDVTIHDNSSKNEYKLLIHCNNEELFQEEMLRRDVLKKERTRKNSVTWKFLGFSGLMFLIAAAWFLAQGQVNLVSFLTGAAGVFVGLATLQQGDRATPFEQRQRAALYEINALLRERGAR